MAGAAQRLRHMTITQPEQFEELRRVWPELVERVERVAEIVDWQRQQE